MPIETIKCQECGSADVTEFKPGSYVCGHCEAIFKHVQLAGLGVGCEVDGCGVLAVGRCAICACAYCASHKSAYDVCDPCAARRAAEEREDYRQWVERAHSGLPANRLTVVLSDATFDQEVEQSSEPVLVLLWAQWVKPALDMLETVEHIARGFQNQLRVASLDIDKAPHVSQRLQVQSIPILFLYKDGEVVFQKVGLIDEWTLVQELRRHL
jgi:thioredoxin 1